MPSYRRSTREKTGNRAGLHMGVQSAASGAHARVLQPSGAVSSRQ
jgi:hypothetical protein